MFGNSSSDFVRNLFADQFEQSGDTFLYRRNQKGAPIPVTAEERERFIRQFKQRSRLLTWGLAAIMVLVVVGLVFAFMQNGEETPSALLWLPILLLIPIHLIVYFWIWKAPQRELANRLPVGPGRSRTEMKRLAMQRLTWPRIGGIAAMSLVAVFRIRWDRSLFSSANLGWLCLAGFVLLAAGISAVRKLRYEQDGSGDRAH